MNPSDENLSGDGQGAGADPIARLVRMAAPRVEPGDEARARVLRVVEAQWRGALARPATSARWRGAVAATVLVAAAGIGALLSVRTAGPAVAQAELVRGFVEEDPGRWWSRAARLEAGAQVLRGRVLNVESDAALMLRYGTGLTVRAAAGTSLRLASAEEIELRHGSLFVDARSAGAQPLRIVTPLGVARHIGTQFLVSLHSQGLELAVREGRVQLLGARGAFELEQLEQLDLPVGGRPRKSRISASDPRFSWIGSLPAPFDLDGRTLDEFLAWFTRESGLTIEWADDLDARALGPVRLQGSIDGLTPERAMRYVLATVDLEAVRSADRLVIAGRHTNGE
jgi:ferric-dicitrate binding protein FerR (iron transport regulator)